MIGPTTWVRSIANPVSYNMLAICAGARSSEFTGHLDLWAYHHGVRIDFSRPGKPTDNAYIETFNGSLRDECLNVHWFETIGQARQLIEAWRSEYNESRPHGALGYLAPSEYAAGATTSLPWIGAAPSEANAEDGPPNPSASIRDPDYHSRWTTQTGAAQIHQLSIWDTIRPVAKALPAHRHRHKHPISNWPGHDLPHVSSPSPNLRGRCSCHLRACGEPVSPPYPRYRDRHR